LNIHSLQLHIDEFRTFLNTLNYKFDIIAISETKLQNEPAINISLPGFRNPIHTFTEATKGGVCIYISVEIDFKPRND
jgi:exonuclease III